MLGLKLSEAVSKALAQPSGPANANEQVGGRRPIPTGRGHALGALIASWVPCLSDLLHVLTEVLDYSELKAANDNPHLYRAILRSLHRPLSVLLSELSSQLLPLISSPAFLTPPSPTVQAPNPNPTQLHALGIATFAGELVETFDELCLGIDADPRGDGLKIVREGLVSVVTRVVNPLVGGIKAALIPLLEALETPSSGATVKPLPGAKLPVSQHPSIVALQSLMPIYARALTRYTVSQTSQTILATFLISVVWRGLVALSQRPYVSGTPPSSPGLHPTTVKKRRGSPSSTPPLTPPASRFTIKLPSPASRPPSPPTLAVPPSTAGDARALYELLNSLPRPAAGKSVSTLASEAVDEAFNGLKALPPLCDAVQALPFKLNGGSLVTNQLIHELVTLANELPTLIALPVVLHAYGSGTSSVSGLLGLPEAEYRASCLTGFGRADECAALVGQRVLGSLSADQEAGAIVMGWLVEEIEGAMEATP